ncbi:MAG: OPT/YSL family transporter, partial [Hymenobacter sp.]|nr:OPT/YSL family transporter [Hymenobacter sp.]
MHKRLFPALALTLLAGCRSAQTFSPSSAAAPIPASSRIAVQYPETRKSDHVDDYFGTPVPDPYRWLEDADSPETKAWVTAQNKVSFGYLEQIPFRDQIRERLTTIWNYERFGVPQEEGGQLYFSKNDGLQNQAVLYCQGQQDGQQGQPDVLLDPNKLSADGTTALAGTFFSHDHRYMAYATSGGGSDWQQYKVMDLKTRQPLPDELNWVKVSGAAWYQDGFFYSRYDAPKARLFSLIIDGILTQKLPWTLVLLGVFIALMLELCGVSSLPFAVGVYLPISTSAPIFCGGIVRYIVDRVRGGKEAESEFSPGMLISSGYIAGGAIAGVVLAMFAIPTWGPDVLR